MDGRCSESFRGCGGDTIGSKELGGKGFASNELLRTGAASRAAEGVSAAPYTDGSIGRSLVSSGSEVILA
jgi:hypothetical protein